MKYEDRLFEMCKTEDFAEKEAKALIKKVNINEPIIFNNGVRTTTYLFEASFYANVEMVKLLLENGASPNMVTGDENSLWDLQYNANDEESYKDDEEYAKLIDVKYLQISQLLLEYGATPFIVVEGKDLFGCVCDRLFNEDLGCNYKYLADFFVLLVAYGGKSNCCCPKIIKPFDKNNMNQYKFSRVDCKDGEYLKGVIIDENDEVVAIV